MRLLEDALKPLLSEAGLIVPAGIRVRSVTELEAFAEGRPRIVFKVLAPHNDRAGRGEIAVVTSGAAAVAYESLVERGLPVWVEEHVPHSESSYLVGVIWPGHLDEPTVIVSEGGGSGVEHRLTLPRESATEPIAAPLSQASTLRLVRDVPGMAAAVAAVAATFECVGAVAIEVNPVVTAMDGCLVALDAKAQVDPYATGVDHRTPRKDERAVAPLEFVPLSGEVGVLSIGAGITSALLDWLAVCGPGAACFSDLIPAVLADAKQLLHGDIGPRCTEAVEWLCDTLATAGKQRLLINLVSGGTPVDALSQSVELGLRGSAWRPLVSVYVGGNRASAARVLWESAGIPCHDTLAAAVEAVVA